MDDHGGPACGLAAEPGAVEQQPGSRSGCAPGLVPPARADRYRAGWRGPGRRPPQRLRLDGRGRGRVLDHLADPALGSRRDRLRLAVLVEDHDAGPVVDGADAMVCRRRREEATAQARADVRGQRDQGPDVVGGEPRVVRPPQEGRRAPVDAVDHERDTQLVSEPVAASWDRCRTDRDRSPWVSMLVAPAMRPLRARKDHLLTSSTTYSWWASHEPEHPTSRLMLPVNRTVPGSTVWQQ